MIAVFNKISCVVDSAQTEVYGHHTSCVRLFAPLHKLIRAEEIGLRNAPGELKPFRPFAYGTYTVLPPVSGNKVSAGVAHYRYAKLFNLVDNVFSEPVFVGTGVMWLIYSAVNGSAEVFYERTEDSVVNLTYFKFAGK